MQELHLRRWRDGPLMNSVTSEKARAGLNRRSKPIVDEAFELMPAPQSDPAT